MNDFRFVQRGLHVEDGLLRRLEHGVEATEHRHRQDHVAVFAADVEIAENVVGDAPNEVSDPVELCVFQAHEGYDTTASQPSANRFDALSVTS